MRGNVTTAAVAKVACLMWSKARERGVSGLFGCFESPLISTAAHRARRTAGAIQNPSCWKHGAKSRSRCELVGPHPSGSGQNPEGRGEEDVDAGKRDGEVALE